MTTTQAISRIPKHRNGRADAQRLMELLDIRIPRGVYIPGDHIIRMSPQQQAFLWYEGLEAMYGGAAGGGKSDALLMAALQYVDVPGYSAIIFRKTYTDLKLPGALMDRARQWLDPTKAKWNDNDKRWTFPSGAKLQFGYLRTELDKFRYQSAEFQFIAFDELTQFPVQDYLYMFSRLRRLTSSHIPLRMRSATNPGGVGHEWVKKRFIQLKGSKNRIFMPAKLSDNQNVDQATYRLALSEMPTEYQEQLLDGNWDAREPGNWMIGDPRWVDISADRAEQFARDVPEPYGEALHICMDWGEHTQAYVVWPLEGGGAYIPPSEVIAKHDDPAKVTPRVLRVAESFSLPVPSARYDAAGVQSMRTFINAAREKPGWNHLKAHKIAFSKYKRETINYIRFLLRRTAEGKLQTVLLIHPANKELIRQLKRWERKDEESDEAVKRDDHGPDALVAGLAPIAAANRRKYLELLEQAKGTQNDLELAGQDINIEELAR